MNLTLNKQQVGYKADTLAKISKIHWPDKASQPTATLTFKDDKGKTISRGETGPWGFFKILDKAAIQPSKNKSSLTYTFDIDGHAAKFDITSSKSTS